MADKWITIKHDKADIEALVTEEAFEKAYKAKGWKKAPKADQPDQPASAPASAPGQHAR